MDFDVHHGNGTEAIVRNLVPSTHSVQVTLCSWEPTAPGLFVLSRPRTGCDEEHTHARTHAHIHTNAHERTHMTVGVPSIRNGHRGDTQLQALERPNGYSMVTAVDSC